MIGVVEKPTARRGVTWAFWIAGGLAAAGGLLPVLLAGTSGRISNVIVPFWLAAFAFVACGVVSHLGKALTTVIYLAGGLAIVYGTLGMFAVLVQLTVLTTCPPGLTSCGLGYTRPLTSAETSGIGYAMALGTLALVIGFFGLRSIYRRGASEPSVLTAPVRRIAPTVDPQGDQLEPASSSVPAAGPIEPAQQDSSPETEPETDGRQDAPTAKSPQT